MRTFSPYAYYLISLLISLLRCFFKKKSKLQILSHLGSWPSLSMQNLKTVHTSRWKIKAVQWLSECKTTSFYVSYFPKIPEYFWKKKSLELTYLFENLSCLHCLSIFVVDNVALTGSVNVLGVPSRSEGKMQLSKFKSELNWIINF